MSFNKVCASFVRYIFMEIIILVSVGNEKHSKWSKDMIRPTE
jgi:hypothetical protein